MKRTKVVDHPHDDELHNEGVAHEASDVNVARHPQLRAIVVVTAIVCAVIVWGMFGCWSARRPGATRGSRTWPCHRDRCRRRPRCRNSATRAAPQLLTNEPDFLRQQRQAEDTQAARVRLGGPEGRRRAGVRSTRRKKLLAERGLPARASAADPQLGTHAPAFGEASGGRTIPTGERPAGGAAATPPAAAPVPAAPATAKEPAAHAPTGRGGGA